MSKPAPGAYTLTFFQLSPDGRKAGGNFATEERTGVTDKELRAILLAAAAVAPGVTYPLAPEIRITAPAGKFVVRLKDGGLRFVSWATAHSMVAEPNVEEMLTIIRGETLDIPSSRAPRAEKEEAGGGILKGWMRVAAIYVLVVVILGVNVFTIMNDRKPPGNFLPAHRLVEAEPATRLLTDVAGNYETGRAPGDRRLQINRDGSVRWIKFGPANKVVEEKTFTVKAAEANGTKALLTNKQSMISIKDPSTVILFGDTYVRVMN